MSFELFKWGECYFFSFWVNNNANSITPKQSYNLCALIASSFTLTIYRRCLELLIQMLGKGQIPFLLI